MASPPVISPGGTTGWNVQKYTDTFEKALYQRLKLVPVIDNAMRLFGGLNVRKMARVAGSVLSQSSDGTGLTYLNIVGTPVLISPSQNIVPVAWTEHEEAQVPGNIDQESGNNILDALGELTEASAAQVIASLTGAPLAVADVTGDTWRRGVGQLMGNTNGYAEPGGTETIYGFFSNTQYPNLGNIPEFNNAEVRGDSENPYVRGIWTKGGGVLMLMSTVVYQDANGWHNCIFHGSAFVQSWNRRSRIVSDQAELQYRRIACNNLGVGIKNDNRALHFITTNNAL